MVSQILICQSLILVSDQLLAGTRGLVARRKVDGHYRGDGYRDAWTGVSSNTVHVVRAGRGLHLSSAV